MRRLMADVWRKMRGLPTRDEMEAMEKLFADANARFESRNEEWRAYELKRKEIDRNLDKFRDADVPFEERQAYFDEAFRLIQEQQKAHAKRFFPES